MSATVHYRDGITGIYDEATSANLDFRAGETTSMNKDEHTIPQISTVHDLRHLNQANTPTMDHTKWHRIKSQALSEFTKWSC